MLTMTGRAFIAAALASGALMIKTVVLISKSELFHSMILTYFALL